MTPPPRFEATFPLRQGYVYLLRSRKDGKFYLGWATHLKRRLDEHNRGLTRSTKGRGPFQLVYAEAYSTVESAKARERALKRHSNMLACFKKRAGVCSSAPIGASEVVG